MTMPYRAIVQCDARSVFCDHRQEAVCPDIWHALQWLRRKRYDLVAYGETISGRDWVADPVIAGLQALADASVRPAAGEALVRATGEGLVVTSPEGMTYSVHAV
jgi:hypothetical protein